MFKLIYKKIFTIFCSKYLFKSDYALFFLQELKICAAIINIFHLIPAASKKMIEPLIKETLQGEKNLLLEVCELFSFRSNDKRLGSG